jgi:hypothetical protein
MLEDNIGVVEMHSKTSIGHSLVNEEQIMPFMA